MTQLEQVKEALLFALTYISYVKEHNSTLHERANGTPNIDEAIVFSLNIINTMLAAKMRTPEECVAARVVDAHEKRPQALR